MKIAVATTDGVSVNEHFGRAATFTIYEVTQDSFNLLSEVTVDPYSTGDKDHPFDMDRFQSVAKKLEGCEKVVVTKIGEPPSAELKKIGIEPIIFSGPIAEINL